LTFLFYREFSQLIERRRECVKKVCKGKKRNMKTSKLIIETAIRSAILMTARPHAYAGVEKEAFGFCLTCIQSLWPILSFLESINPY
jgi:hypothetical protein